MFNIFDDITEWFKEILVSGIVSNFEGMFNNVNSKVSDIAVQVGTTPEGWNEGIFNLIKTLSDTVIIPIAGIILTFVLCYELINMIIDQNNLHNMDTWMFFKWTFKAFIAIYMVTHTFDFVMGIFSVSQHVVNSSAGIIKGDMNMNIAIDELQATLQAMEWGELLGLYIESTIIKLAMEAISLCIFVIVYGRMIEIFLTISVAPIPFATMTNREWGQVGNHYIKSLLALGFQGFLIMICVAIYAILIQNITASDNIHIALLECAGYTVLLCFTLFKTSSLAKGIFGG